MAAVFYGKALIAADGLSFESIGHKILASMKTLFLMRHAKSSWDDASLADFDRPLNGRGLIAAPFMGELMVREDFLPQVIVSSPAKRAMQTALLVQESSGSNSPLRYEERIYEASPMTLRTVASQIDEAFSSVMFVGHNPGMEGFIRYLTGAIEPMPTAAFAAIEIKIDKWSAIDAGCGRLVAVFRPKYEMAKAVDN